MRSYNLNIAGYNIRIESAEDGPDLVPSFRFRRNIVQNTEYDVRIKVHNGAGSPMKMPRDYLLHPMSLR
jgi:hypothetical protein